jgi:hypothetical protein
MVPKRREGLMSDHTPTTDDVRQDWLYAWDKGDENSAGTAERLAKFDRWLAEHDRQVADALIAEGWRKMPSRAQLAEAVGEAQEEFMREDLPEDGLTENVVIADAVLALVDGGQ